MIIEITKALDNMTAIHPSLEGSGCWTNGTTQVVAKNTQATNSTIAKSILRNFTATQ
jgi:hypothetical protein